MGQNVFCEQLIIRDDSCRQVVRQVVEGLEEEINIVAGILYDEREWTKELSGHKVSTFLIFEMLQRYFDCCWFI